MSWDLEADILPSGAPSLVAQPLVEFFSADLQSLLISSDQGQDIGAPTVARERVSWTGPETRWLPVLESQLAEDRVTRVVFGLTGAGGERSLVEPTLTLYGDSLRGLSNLRGRAPVLFDFGRRGYWRGKERLASGAVLDEDRIVQALTQLCRQSSPLSVDLLNEEGSDVPFNQHFVYRADTGGFLQDLRDIAQISLRGGAGAYTDGRARYEAIVQSPRTMLLCKRSGEYRERFLAFLDTKLRRLDVQGLPRQLDSALIEDALLATEDLGFFTHGSGVGIWNKPLFGGYVELFYLDLIERLLGEGS